MSEEMMAEMRTSSTPDPFAQYVQELFALANGENIPSGILHWSTFSPYRIAEFDGTDWRGVCDQPTWMQLYTEMVNGEKRVQKGDPSLPSTDDLRAAAATFHDRGETPIAIAAFDYHMPKKPFVARVLAGARNEKLPSIEELTVERIVEGKRAFFVSALLPDASNDFKLLPHVHYGRELRFVVPRALYFSNLEVPAYVEVDFDDCEGFRRVAFDEVVEVTYADTLPRQIRVRAAGLAGACRLAIGKPAPDPKHTWPLNVYYNGRPVHGRAFVYYGKGHTAITDPVIFADGFGERATDLDVFWNRLNEGERMIEKMLDRGRDVILLGYGSKSDAIQANGLLAVACIERTIRERVGTKPLYVAGGSMGSLVTRYALALMESEGKDHQTARYLSYDGPHGNGAWIPYILQNFLYYFEDEDDCAKRMANLNRSIAAQQMLWVWTPSWDYSGQLNNNPHKLAFRNALPHNGFPQRTRRYAVANGKGDGAPNRTPAGQVAVDWGGDACVGAELCTVPAFSTDHQYVGKLWLKSLFARLYYVQNFPSFDSAPGGLSENFGLAGDAAHRSGYGFPTIYYRKECFVPTICALGMRTANIFTNIPQFGVGNSEFHEIFWSSETTDHCAVTPELCTWVLDRLAPLTAEEEAEDAA